MDTVLVRVTHDVLKEVSTHSIGSHHTVLTLINRITQEKDCPEHNEPFLSIP